MRFIALTAVLLCLTSAVVLIPIQMTVSQGIPQAEFETNMSPPRIKIGPIYYEVSSDGSERLYEYGDFVDSNCMKQSVRFVKGGPVSIDFCIQDPDTHQILYRGRRQLKLTAKLATDIIEIVNNFRNYARQRPDLFRVAGQRTTR